MLIPGMLFQDQSWNSFQKLLGDAALDFYEVHGCDELIDWPNWKGDAQGHSHWPKFRRHLLLSVEEFPAADIQTPPMSMTAAQASARDRANSFNKIIKRSAWHEDARSSGLTGKDLARELVLALGQFEDKSGVPVLLKSLGNKLRQAQVGSQDKTNPRTKPADEGADEDDGDLAAFLDAQDAATAQAQAQEAHASPLRARWRQATNWVLKDLRDKVDVARYNAAWASAMVSARDRMTEHQLHRLRWVDAYLRDLDRFLALGDLVRDHFPAVFGPAWAQAAGKGGAALTMDKLPVAEAAESLLAYDRQHQELGAMLRQRLDPRQQRSMLLLHVKTPLCKRGNKFTATPASVSTLITKLRAAAFAVANTDSLERMGVVRRDDNTGELQVPEAHFVEPTLCEKSFQKLLQVDRSAWPGEGIRMAETSGKKTRRPTAGPGRQIQPSAAMTRKAEKLILSHMETYPLMIQAALLKMHGHGRLDAKTVELLRSKGVFERVGCECTLAALNFEVLGAANVDLLGRPAPLSAQAFATAFAEAEARFGEFIRDSAETLMAVQN